MNPNNLVVSINTEPAWSYTAADTITEKLLTVDSAKTLIRNEVKKYLDEMTLDNACQWFIDKLIWTDKFTDEERENIKTALVLNNNNSFSILKSILKKV